VGLPGKQVNMVQFLSRVMVDLHYGLDLAAQHQPANQ